MQTVDKVYKNNNMKLPGNVSTANIEYTSEVEVNGNETLSSSYTSEEKDKSVILATDRGETDVCGIMIYQSMSGDASEGTGTLNCTDSTLSVLESSSYYKTAPMFFITNTDAVINLQNTKLVYGSNILLSAKGTNQWGKSGQNGGNVTLNATNQELNGNIELDNISKLVMNLTKSSYEGTINANNSAKSIDLKLDDTSNIKLTGDSYVTSLEDADTSYSNIDFNGYKLYVNGTAIN